MSLEVSHLKGKNSKEVEVKKLLINVTVHRICWQGPTRIKSNLWLPKMTTQKTRPSIWECCPDTFWAPTAWGHARCPAEPFPCPLPCGEEDFLNTQPDAPLDISPHHWFHASEVLSGLFHCLWLSDDLGSGQNVSTKSTWACTVNVYVCYWYLKVFNWWN